MGYRSSTIVVNFSWKRVRDAELFLKGCPQASCYGDTWLWWSLTFSVQNWFAQVQMCRHTHLHIWLTSQCQSKGSCQNPQPSNRDSLDFKKELIRWHNGTQCPQTAMETTQADTKKASEDSSLAAHCQLCGLLHGTHCSCIRRFHIYGSVPLKEL